MVKKFRLLTLLAIVWCLFVSKGLAAENLNDWQAFIETGAITFDPSGESTSISASITGDGEAWGKIYKLFAGSCGAKATFTIDSLSNADEANVAIGIRKYLGQNEAGNLLLAELKLSCYYGKYRVFYRIRERATDHSTIRILAKGWVGDNLDVFSIGESVTLGIFKAGCDVVFHSSTNPGLTKINNCEFSTFPVSQSGIDIEVFCNSNSDITGTVSNVKPIYSAAQAESLFDGTQLQSYEQAYKAGIADATSAPTKAEPLMVSRSAINGDFNFFWKTVPNATWYYLWIGDPSGNRIFKEWYLASDFDTGAGFCYIPVDIELSEGDYEWYIKSWNDYGKIWNDGMSLTVTE